MDPPCLHFLNPSIILLGYFRREGDKWRTIPNVRTKTIYWMQEKDGRYSSYWFYWTAERTKYAEGAQNLF